METVEQFKTRFIDDEGNICGSPTEQDVYIALMIMFKDLYELNNPEV